MVSTSDQGRHRSAPLTFDVVARTDNCGNQLARRVQKGFHCSSKLAPSSRVSRHVASISRRVRLNYNLRLSTDGRAVAPRLRRFVVSRNPKPNIGIPRKVAVGRDLPVAEHLSLVAANVSLV